MQQHVNGGVLTICHSSWTSTTDQWNECHIEQIGDLPKDLLKNNFCCKYKGWSFKFQIQSFNNSKSKSSSILLYNSKSSFCHKLL